MPRRWGKRFRSEIHHKLLTTVEQKVHYAEFLYEDLLTGDFAAKATYYREQFNMGAITVDEIREAENRNPYPDGIGSHPVVNGAYARLADLGREPAPPEEGRAYNPDHMASAKALAEQFGVEYRALRSRLDRWRSKTPADDGAWAEMTVSSPSQAQYLYRVADILPIVQATQRVS